MSGFWHQTGRAAKTCGQAALIAGVGGFIAYSIMKAIQNANNESPQKKVTQVADNPELKSISIDSSSTQSSIQPANNSIREERLKQANNIQNQLDAIKHQVPFSRYKKLQISIDRIKTNWVEDNFDKKLSLLKDEIQEMEVKANHLSNIAESQIKELEARGYEVEQQLDNGDRVLTVKLVEATTIRLAFNNEVQAQSKILSENRQEAIAQLQFQGYSVQEQ